MNKLVRDYIPNVIPKEDLHRFRFVRLTDEDYAEHLKKKLVEEVAEYLQAENKEELADIYEVLEAIIKFKGFDLEEVRQVQQNKRDVRGGFEERLLMQKVTV